MTTRLYKRIVCVTDHSFPFCSVVGSNKNVLQSLMQYASAELFWISLRNQHTLREYTQYQYERIGENIHHVAAVSVNDMVDWIRYLHPSLVHIVQDVDNPRFLSHIDTVFQHCTLHRVPYVLTLNIVDDDANATTSASRAPSAHVLDNAVDIYVPSPFVAEMLIKHHPIDSHRIHVIEPVGIYYQQVSSPSSVFSALHHSQQQLPHEQQQHQQYREDQLHDSAMNYLLEPMLTSHMPAHHPPTGPSGHHSSTMQTSSDHSLLSRRTDTTIIVMDAAAEAQCRLIMQHMQDTRFTMLRAFHNTSTSVAVAADVGADATIATNATYVPWPPSAANDTWMHVLNRSRMLCILSSPSPSTTRPVVTNTGVPPGTALDVQCALIDAFQWAVPVLNTSPWYESYVIDNVNGYHVRAGEPINVLMDKIHLLRIDNALYARMCLAAHRMYGERYSPERMYHRMGDVILQTTNKARAQYPVMLFTTWCDDRSGILARILHQALVEQGCLTTIFAYSTGKREGYAERNQRDPSEWVHPNGSVHYSSHSRDSVPDSEVLKWVQHQRVSRCIFVTDTNSSRIFELATMLRSRANIRVYAVPSVESIRSPDVWKHHAFDGLIALNRMCKTTLRQHGFGDRIVPVYPFAVPSNGINDRDARHVDKDDAEEELLRLQQQGDVSVLSDSVPQTPNDDCDNITSVSTDAPRDPLVPCIDSQPSTLRLLCIGGLNAFTRKQVPAVLQAFALAQERLAQAHPLPPESHMSTNQRSVPTLHLTITMQSANDAEREVLAAYRHRSDVSIQDEPLTHCQIQQRYHEHDVVIYVSRVEGIALGLYEAVAAGLPIITINQLPYTEIVTDGVNGIVLPCDGIAVPDNAMSIMGAGEVNVNVLSESIVKLATTVDVASMKRLARRHLQDNTAAGSFGKFAKRLTRGIHM